MSESTLTRARGKSWRAAVALAGIAAMAVPLGQSVSTLAQTNKTVETSGSQVATGNFFPTPLTGRVWCTTTGSNWNVAGKRAEISWDAVPGATGYRMELIDRSSGELWDTRDVGSATTTIGGISAVWGSNRYGLYARVRTMNGTAISSGFTVSNIGMSFKDYVSGRTECEGPTGTSAPNDDWEDTTQWDPSTPPPALASQRSAVTFGRSAQAAAVGESEIDEGKAADQIVEQESKEAAANTNELSREDSSKPSTTSKAPSTTTTAKLPTSQPPTTIPSPRPSSTSPSAPSPSVTTAPKPPETPSSPAEATTRAKASATLVALPNGRRAEIVDGTELVVSAGGEPTCTAEVRSGTTLKVSDGSLYVTDAVGTRIADPETCQLR